MNLPEKYKGATPGPWEAYDINIYSLSDEAGQGDIVCVPPTFAEASMERWKDNARLIADAPMLACRVAELEEILSRVLPYAESRAEDLTEFKEAGQEDPEFPGADEAWTAVQDGYAALAASPFGLAADPESQARADHEGRTR